MPEHDETDAPEEDDVATEFWADLTEEERRRKSKADRWKVEDKVVDSETK